MIAVNPMTMPKYSQMQLVCFSGGIGAVKSYQADSGTWIYAVEMPLDPKLMIS
jgi:DNA-binding transcriptional regulator LsrR (DeoR family)